MRSEDGASFSRAAGEIPVVETELARRRPLLLVLANNEKDVNGPGVSDRWLAPFDKEKFKIVTIPFDISRGTLERLIQKADGIMLPGGDSNVHPFIYGKKPISPNRIFDKGERPTMEFNAQRDLLAIILAQEAARRNIPLLGICRGMQEMNVAFGGKLRQHIAGHDVGYAYPSRVAEDVHVIRLAEGGILSRILGSTTANTNSTHRQGMLSEDIAEGFVIEAVAEDGVVEAISIPAHRFFIGVQHHPEFTRYAPDNAALFRAFAESILSHYEERATLRPQGEEHRARRYG